MRNNNRGLIHLILLIIIVIIILSYLGINIKSVIERETFKENFDYVWDKVKYVWNNYLERTVEYLLEKLKNSG
jgi:hypothetical protein